MQIAKDVAVITGLSLCVCGWSCMGFMPPNGDRINYVVVTSLTRASCVCVCVCVCAL